MAPDVVWDDETWVLSHHTSDASVALTLRGRGAETLGQLDDEQASQLGRITNRLVRIVENLAGAEPVVLHREPGTQVDVTFTASGLDATQLSEIAGKLANWGGTARA